MPRMSLGSCEAGGLGQSMGSGQTLLTPRLAELGDLSEVPWGPEEEEEERRRLPLSPIQSGLFCLG